MCFDSKVHVAESFLVFPFMTEKDRKPQSALWRAVVQRGVHLNLWVGTLPGEIERVNLDVTFSGMLGDEAGLTAQSSNNNNL